MAKTKKELEERTIWFLNIVEKHNLCFKWSRCDFNTEEIPILGVVGQIGVQMEDKESRKFFRICKFS